MSSFLQPVNSQSNQSIEETGNGFLYKIKNNNNKTMGYLFGTIHEVPSNLSLNKKIIKSLGHSKYLFLERNLLDKETLVEHLKANKNFSIKDESIIHEKAKEIIEETKKNPRSVENILTLKALSIGLEIKNLETEASRQIAHQSIDGEKEHLNIIKLFFVVFFIHQARECLQQAGQMEKMTDLDTFCTNLFKGCESLINAIENANFYDNFLDIWKPQIVELIDLYNEVFNRLNTKFMDLNFDIMDSIKALYIAKVKDYKNKSVEMIQLAWRKGDEKLMEAIDIGTVKKSFVESKDEELSLKELQIRDKFIVDRIHNDLLKLPEGKRSFYAIGCHHFIGNYENVRKNLEKKGWKIINSYKG
jgi:uncharacterized protein YbaP (TraB family)